MIVCICNLKVALYHAHERGDHYSVATIVTQYTQCQTDLVNVQAELILRYQDLWDRIDPYGTQNTYRRTPD